MPLLRHRFDRLFIERNEGFAAQPMAFIRHDAVGEIAASFEDREPGFNSGPVHHDISSIQQIANRHKRHRKPRFARRQAETRTQRLAEDRLAVALRGPGGAAAR